MTLLITKLPPVRWFSSDAAGHCQRCQAFACVGGSSIESSPLYVASHQQFATSELQRLDIPDLQSPVFDAQAANVALLLVVLLRSSESVGIKAAVLMLLLLVAVSGMLITQHFAQLASQQHSQHAAAGAQPPAQRTRQQPSASQRYSVQGVHTLQFTESLHACLPAH